MGSTRVFKTINGNIVIQLYNPATDLEGTLKAYQEGFVQGENVFRACGVPNPGAVQARKDLEDFSLANLKDGISLVARHLPSNKIVGFSINKLQSRPAPGTPSFLEEFRNKHCHAPESRHLVDFLIFSDGKYNLFEKFNTECFIECLFLATLPDFRKMKIAQHLVESSVELTKEIAGGKYPDTMDQTLEGKVPKLLFAIWTSKYSAKIGDNLGFTILEKIRYTEFKIGGVPSSERIPPEHTHFVLSAKEI
ncbi:uncharacterized protein DMENIID0001_101500 [Sergentomyia squamirostris]